MGLLANISFFCAHSTTIVEIAMAPAGLPAPFNFSGVFSGIPTTFLVVTLSCLLLTGVNHD